MVIHLLYVKWRYILLNLEVGLKFSLGYLQFILHHTIIVKKAWFYRFGCAKWWCLHYFLTKKNEGVRYNLEINMRIYS